MSELSDRIPGRLADMTPEHRQRARRAVARICSSQAGLTPHSTPEEIAAVRADVRQICEHLGLHPAPASERAPGRCSGCGAELAGVSPRGTDAAWRSARRSGLCPACWRSR